MIEWGPQWQGIGQALWKQACWEWDTKKKIFAGAIYPSNLIYLVWFFSPTHWQILVKIMISAINFLIQDICFKNSRRLGLFLVSSNCLVLLILFYWLHFSIVCPKGREGQTAIMKYEWDASLTFGLSSTWKRLIYVLEKRSLEALQGVEGREEGQLTLWLANSSMPSAGMVPALTQRDPALH